MSLSHAPENALSELREGGYYSIRNGNAFSVAKILKLEEEIVHVRIYKQKFSERPASIERSKLTLGTIHDSDGFGMGHLPLRRKSFAASDPVFLTHSEVKPEELSGYDVWRDADGGVWE